MTLKQITFKQLENVLHYLGNDETRSSKRSFEPQQSYALNSSPSNYPKQTTMTTLPNTKFTFPLKLAIGTVLFSCLLATTTASAAQQNTSVEDLLNMEIEDLMKVKIVTIATGAKQTLAQAPAVATVITADDIEAIGATDLDDVLETVPGLHVGRSTLYNPIYTLRGIYSSYNPEILVLVNGNPINTLYTGGRTLLWGGMPVNAIARIEIIKGPGSALYGADAFAGVINLITKTKADIGGTEVGLRGGSFNTQDAWLLHGQTWQGFDVALAVEYHNTDGQREIVAADAQTQFDKLFGTHASLAPGSVNLSRQNLEANLDIAKGAWRWRTNYQGRRNFGDGAGVGQALDPQGQMASDRLNTDLTYHNADWIKHWDVTAQLNYFETSYETTKDFAIFPPGAFGGTYPDGYLGNTALAERHTRVHLSAFYSGIENHSIRVGTGYHYGDLYNVKSVANFGTDPATGLPLPPGGGLVDFSNTPYTFMPTQTRQDWYVFLQEVWAFHDHWELTAGARYDNYSDFGSTFNPRLALVWQTTPDLTSKILYGQAFRAPAFQELYQANNPVAAGNPHLQPEQMEMWELALDYRATKTLRGALNLFTYQISDQILFAPASGIKARTLAQNVGSQEGQGMEMEVQWKPLNHWSVSGNYSYQHSVDHQDHDPGNTPHQQAYLRTDWQFWPDWQLTAQAKWITGRQRVFGDARPPVNDYTIIDLTLRHQFMEKTWKLAMGIRNLLDTNAHEPSPGPDTSGMTYIPNDFPLAGRNYFMELRYRF